jgi:hypothetical protein
LIEAWPDFDPQKGAEQQFANSVLNKKAATLLRKHCRQKRPNDTLRRDFDTHLLEMPAPHDDIEKLLLVIDVQKKLQRMSGQAREVLEQLKTKAPYRVSKEMNITRFKLDQLMRNSRVYFQEYSEDFYSQTEEVFMQIPLNFLDEASAREVSNIPIQGLQALAARLKEAIETQDRRRKVLNEAMRLRFEDTARAKLNQEGKDTGTVRFQEGNTTVIANFRKRVDWEQEELARILAEHPEYKPEVKCALSLEERKYNNWPLSIQKIFEPARSVKSGGYEFSFNNLEEI